MAEILNPGEHIEYIDGSLRLIVSKEHTFGTDALLLAAFCAPKKHEKVCDFGTGCGIIPFYWLSRGTENASAVELQESAVGQLRRSVELNGLENRLSVINGDIRKLDGSLPAGSFDLISMNPPYTSDGRGIKSSSQADLIARHETSLNLDGLFSAASRLLRFGGRICICMRPERLAETFFSMKKYGIEPKRLRFVSLSAGKAPWLFLAEGKVGRNSGMTVEHELYLKDGNGNDSEEMTEILGAYRKK